jgi:hypothetical protein
MRYAGVAVLSSRRALIVLDVVSTTIRLTGESDGTRGWADTCLWQTPHCCGFDERLSHPSGYGELSIVDWLRRCGCRSLHTPRWSSGVPICFHPRGSFLPVVNGVSVDYGDLVWAVQHGQGRCRNEVPGLLGQMGMSPNRRQETRRDDGG